MNSALIGQIIEKLSSRIISKKDTFVKFSNKAYTSMNFSADNFKKVEHKACNGKIVFIDGGNQEILSSPDFSLQLIRIACVFYEKNKRIKFGKNEFYCFISAQNIDDEINYKCEFFNITGGNFFEKEILIDSMDSSLKQGNRRVNISSIGNVIRKYAELIMASQVARILDKGDIIVRDGTLECEFIGEYEYFEKLYSIAEERKLIICGLAKTTNLYTDAGNSVVNFLNTCDFGTWYYHPVAQFDMGMHKAKMYFVKLHERAEHIFRFEIYKNSEFNIDQILSLLVDNSKDPVFIGYPYGLIDVDRFARVSNREVDYIKTQFMAKAGEKFKDIQKSLRATDAHVILDNIS